MLVKKERGKMKESWREFKRYREKIEQQKIEIQKRITGLRG
jgi:hypothetical protein